MARWAGVTPALAATPVTPRPTEAGVLGMARAMAVAGRRAAMSPMVLPAMMESTSVPSPTSGAMSGAAWSSICGLMASTSTSGALRLAMGGLRATPLPVQRATSSGAANGSKTQTAEGGSPRASHPCSMAPPILPAPTSTSEAGRPVDDMPRPRLLFRRAPRRGPRARCVRPRSRTGRPDNSARKRRWQPAK